MKRPSKVLIGGCSYRMRYLDEPHENDGDCDFSARRITVRTCDKQGPYDEDYVQETTLHEVLHGVLDSTGLKYTHFKENYDAEERFINAITPSLRRFLIENPDVVKYITNA